MNFKLAICIFLFSTKLVFSQKIKEVQLAKPDQLNSFFITSFSQSTIHYGAKPDNYNGKVLVFNHGYTDLNHFQFFVGNTFYKDTYSAGYQSAFVSTTRGEGLWVNGKILSEAIDIITKKFKVRDVSLIAYSNGGKAAESAMFANGASDKVNRAFALGTPFRGTYLANISQMPWLDWAVKLIGLNNGAMVSTTYYCNNVVRPFFDNNPLNEPNKFVTFGSSGHSNGSDFINSKVLKITGDIILPIEGINDGVASYYSSIRPGSELVFEENDPRALFDHTDMSKGKYSWPYIKAYLENPQLKSGIEPKQRKYSDQTVMKSDYYIIHSENSYDAISFDKNSNYALAEVLHEDQYANFSSYNTQSKTRKQQKKAASEVGFSSKIPLYKTEIGAATRLESNSKFVAFVKQNTNLTMSLAVSKKQEHPLLKVQIEQNNKILEDMTGINVHGVIIRNDDDSTLEVINFIQKEDTFTFDTSELSDGVYSLMLQSEKEGTFKRSLISGFVVGSLETLISTSTTSTTDQQNNFPTDKTVLLTPTVVKNEAILSFTPIQNAEDVTVSIYDITGKKIQQFSLGTQKLPNYAIGRKLSKLKNGIYLLKAGEHKTIKFIKK